MKEFYVTKIDVLNCESTSKGNQKKWYKDGFYIKADCLGYESVAEAVVSDMLAYIGYIPFVDYKLCLIHDDNDILYGCYSQDMLEDGESLVSIYRLMEQYNLWNNLISKKCNGLDRVNLVVDSLSEFLGLDKNYVCEYLGRMVCLDAIVLNEDRHFNNISIVRGNTIKLSPIFDNGLSLLSDTNDYSYDNDVEKNIRMVRAKPFSTDFIKQIGYFNEILHFDAYAWLESLENKYAEFKDRDFRRCKAVLRRRIRRLEGIAWTE